MLFSLRELGQWRGFATFEIFVHLLAFSVLLALRVDGLAPGLSWWNVFVPFFAADGLSAYFTTIVSVRLFQDGEKRLAVLRLFWILTVLSLKFVFEVLLCQKLVEQTRQLWFGLITSPVVILLQLLMIRTCRVNRPRSGAGRGALRSQKAGPKGEGHPGRVRTRSPAAPGGEVWV